MVGQLIAYKGHQKGKSEGSVRKRGGATREQFSATRRNFPTTREQFENLVVSRVFLPSDTSDFLRFLRFSPISSDFSDFSDLFRFLVGSMALPIDL